ncbi:MAG: dockerin type I domain-containing protein [Candidatus Woesearchaeota archaeon]|jgi:hypothetical protein|nr:dockerin type I domain-containing protein [Candidatus Woesearchaeota archaeon]
MLERILNPLKRAAVIGLGLAVGATALNHMAKRNESLDLLLSYFGATNAHAAQLAPDTGIPFPSLPGFPQQVDAGAIVTADFVGEDGEPEIYAGGMGRLYGWETDGQPINSNPDGTFFPLGNNAPIVGIPAMGEIADGIRAIVIPADRLYVVGPDGREILDSLSYGNDSTAPTTIASLDGERISIIGSGRGQSSIHVYDVHNRGGVLEAVTRTGFPMGATMDSSPAIGQLDPTSPELELAWGQGDLIQAVNANGIPFPPYPITMIDRYGSEGSPAVVDVGGVQYLITGVENDLIISGNGRVIEANADADFASTSPSVLKMPDGTARIFASNYDGGTWGFEFDGNIITPLVGFPQETQGRLRSRSPLIGYFGDDGIPKVVQADVDGNIYAWYAEGGMEGIPVAPFPIDLGSPIRHIALGHYTGVDGLHAILAASAEGNVHALDLGLESRARDHPWPSFQYDDANTGNPNYQEPQGQPQRAWDVNGDNLINIVDLILVARDFGKMTTGAADVSGDGRVNIVDLILVAQHFGEVYGAPSMSASERVPHIFDNAYEKALVVWGEIKQGADYGVSIGDVERALELFDKLRDGYVPEDITPAQTVLMNNYPDPFNPETWIPFMLGEGGNVRVSIYNRGGSLVRTLDLGHREPGVYDRKDEAAHWDGRNEFGEKAASGLYFYRLNNGPTGRMMLGK